MIKSKPVRPILKQSDEDEEWQDLPTWPTFECQICVELSATLFGPAHALEVVCLNCDRYTIPE